MQHSGRAHTSKHGDRGFESCQALGFFLLLLSSVSNIPFGIVSLKRSLVKVQLKEAEAYQ